MNGPVCSGKTTLAKRLQHALCLQFARRAPDILRLTRKARVWHIECDVLEQQMWASEAEKTSQQQQQEHQVWSRELWRAAQKLALETARAIMAGSEGCPNYDSLTQCISVCLSNNEDHERGDRCQGTFDIVLVDDNMLKRSSRKKYCAAASEHEFEFVQVCLQTPLDVCVARNGIRNRQSAACALKETDCCQERTIEERRTLPVPDAVVLETHSLNEVRRCCCLCACLNVYLSSQSMLEQKLCCFAYIL